VKVVGRALELLKLLKHFERMSLSELSSSLGVRRNSAWNLLNYLRSEGYVERCDRGVYSLGEAFRELSGPCSEPSSPDGLEQALRKLSSSIKESCVAARLSGTSLELLASFDFERDLMVRNSIYDRVDSLYCWAAGHALLATQSWPVVEAVAKRNGLPKASQWPGAQSLGRLKAELERTREAGYAERFNSDGQICSLAVPAESPSGARLALGVAYPKSRDTKMHRQAILANLKLLAEGISGGGGKSKRALK